MMLEFLLMTDSHGLHMMSEFPLMTDSNGLHNQRQNIMLWVVFTESVGKRRLLPTTNPQDCYFEYLIIRFDYLIIRFDYLIIG